MRDGRAPKATEIIPMWLTDDSSDLSYWENARAVQVSDTSFFSRFNIFGTLDNYRVHKKYAFSFFRTRIATCISNRVETGPDFVP